MTKDDIRAAAKQKRRALSHEEISAKSRAITERLIPYLEGAVTVMCYLAAFNEPRTNGIIDYLVKLGKRVAVPVSDTATCTITPSYLTGSLISGAYGISEPEEIIKADIKDIDIAIIPGIAFDRAGMRIGFGKGYYDRFLGEFEGLKIGVCYDFQVYDKIPHDEHDVAMDMIITERTAYDF